MFDDQTCVKQSLTEQRAILCFLLLQCRDKATNAIVRVLGKNGLHRNRFEKKTKKQKKQKKKKPPKEKNALL